MLHFELSWTQIYVDFDIFVTSGNKDINYNGIRYGENENLLNGIRTTEEIILRIYESVGEKYDNDDYKYDNDHYIHNQNEWEL